MARYLQDTIFIFFLFLFVVLLFFAFPASAAQKSAQPSATLVAYEVNSMQDYRVRILTDFLSDRNSALADFASDFVKQADRYKIDWRLLAAISGVESTFGKQLPTNSYNAWGWGIYENHVTYFSSYEDAITTISKSLREDYMDKWGAQNVYQIARMYAASPTWAQRVEAFMDKIEQFAKTYPLYSLSISL